MVCNIPILQISLHTLLIGGWRVCGFQMTLSPYWCCGMYLHKWLPCALLVVCSMRVFTSNAHTPTSGAVVDPIPRRDFKPRVT
jgi:hypothetical protein